MDKIALIKAEIERRKSELKRYYNDDLIKFRAYDEMLSILSTIESEKPVPNDLEEAAEKYATEWHENPDGSAWKPYFEVSAIKAFIAGAKWQENKDQETIKLAEDHAFLAGADWQKEQMMKDFPKWRRIKEGERLPCPAYVWTIVYDNYPGCFEGRLMPNVEGVRVGRDTWYLPVDVIHNLPKED